MFVVSTAALLQSKPTILLFLNDFLHKNDNIPLPQPKSRISFTFLSPSILFNESQKSTKYF